MKLFYKYMAIFVNLSPSLNYLHPLQGENCYSNSRLVVGEDDNGKLRLERVNMYTVVIEFTCPKPGPCMLCFPCMHKRCTDDVHLLPQPT